MFDFRDFHSDFFSSEFSVASVSGIEPDIEMSLEFRRFMSFSTPSAYRTDWKENEDGINYLKNLKLLFLELWLLSF